MEMAADGVWLVTGFYRPVYQAGSPRDDQQHAEIPCVETHEMKPPCQYNQMNEQPMLVDAKV